MKTKKLSEISDIQYGYAFDSHYFTNDNKYPQLVRIRDIKRGFSETYYLGKYNEDYVVHYGDLLIGMDGNFNISRWKSEDALLNQRVCKIAAKQDIIDEEYLQYALSRRLKHIEEKTAFVTVKHLSAKTLSNLKLEVPSQVEQIKIAQIISKISKAINTKKDELRKLDELIKARFVEMFGNYPNNEKSWPVGKIKDLVLDVRYGTSKKATDGTSGKYPYLRMNNITYDGNLNLSDLKTIDLPLEDLEKYTVQKGDLLFNRTNSRDLVGKTCVYDLDKTMVLAGFIIRVRLDTTVANPVFVSKFLNTGYSKLLLRTICKNASGQSNINAKEMQNIKIYVPPISLQNEFANFVQQVDKSKFENIVYLNKMLLMKILSQLGDVSRD